MTKDKTLRPFSALQYYFAHARNRVHLMVGLPRAVSENEFRALLADVIAAAPQLLWQESLSCGGHLTAESGVLDDLIEYRAAASADDARSALIARLDEPLNDIGQSAFRAICHQADKPDASGVRTWISFQTTHALMEGGDIASILRRRASVHDARPIVDTGLGPVKRFAAAIMPALLWGPHMLMAATEKRDPAKFVFLNQAMNRDDVTAAARRLAVSQRALVFGLVAHSLVADPAQRRPVSIVYSTLPAQRSRISDDAFLNVRSDDVRVRMGADLEADIRATAAALDARGPSPIFVQVVHHRLTQWHQTLHSRLPRLYPSRFFGFAPYDLILSMVPPISPGRFSPLLEGGRAFAGSNTGSAPSCVMVPTRDSLSLTVWASPGMQARFDRLRSSAEAMGIRCDVTVPVPEAEVAQGPTERSA